MPGFVCGSAGAAVEVPPHIRHVDLGQVGAEPGRADERTGKIDHRITVDDRRRGAGAETDRPRGRRPRHPGGLSAATPNSAPKRPDLSPRGRTATKVCPFGRTSRPVWVNITPQTSARQDQADGVTGTSEGDPSHLVGSLGAGAQDAADRTRVLRPLEIRGLDGLDQ